MKKNYIDVPKYTTFKDIVDNNFSLSASQYKAFEIKNKNQKLVSDFLDRDLVRSDLGREVGSSYYVDYSPYIFIKTKALQPETYLLNQAGDAIEYIVPQVFESFNLKKGDLLISKDSNVGEIAIVDKDYPDAALCGGIYRLPVSKNKYYLLGFIKSELFRQQIDFLVPKGSTIRHGKTKFLECKIPMPNINTDKTIKYVEVLVQAIVNKEIAIRSKHEMIMGQIQKELEDNQLDSKFVYAQPSIDEIIKSDRMDSSLYSKEFKQKEFLIKNYKNGTSDIEQLGFKFVRGNNLAISVIGKSIYSDTYQEGFSTLILPKNISKYGTINKYEYLGNKSKLLNLKKGAVVFGAEGNEKGRSWVMLEDGKNVITNFHGLSLYQEKENEQKSIFIKLFLDYLRKQGMIDAYATGSNGGSLSIKYWGVIPFPNFGENVEKELVSQYHNADVIFDAGNQTLDSFLAYDNAFNEKAAIYEIDKSMKYLQKLLETAIQSIAEDCEVEIHF
jgi:type I restriction enzyme S subunit